jgi:hypothetical protein
MPNRIVVFTAADRICATMTLSRVSLRNITNMTEGNYPMSNPGCCDQVVSAPKNDFLEFGAPQVMNLGTGGARFSSVVSAPATPQFDALHEQIRLERRVQCSDQVHNHGPDQVRADFCDRVVACRASATTVRGIFLKVDPPSLTIRSGPEVRVAPVTATKSRVSANGDINLRVACVRRHSRRHTPFVERLGHLLKCRRNHTDQASRGGLTEIFLGRGPAGCFIAGLRHASLVVGKDGVKFLLDVFGHTQHSESAPSA